MANYEVVVCHFGEFDRNLSASPIPGSIDMQASLNLAQYHGLDSREINPNKNPLLDPLRSRSVRIHIDPTTSTPDYVTATSEFALDAQTAIDIANPFRSRKEMHGFHVLPACFKIAELLCPESVSSLMLTKLKISAPIHTNLKLVAFEGMRPTRFSDMESPLLAQFECGERKIIVRGFLPKSERPIRYAFDDATDIGVWDSSEIPYDKISDSKYEFRQVMIPDYDNFKPLIDHNPAIATLMVLELAEIFGRHLLNFDELEFGREIPGKIWAFIGKVSEFKLHDANALKSCNQIGIKAILNLELARAGYVDNAHLVPAEFDMVGLSEDSEEIPIAKGVITVAGISRKR